MCSERLSFSLDRESTIAELRALVVTSLHIEEGSVEGGGRFRKADGIMPGTLIDDESETLSQAYVRDGGVLWFESGRPITKHEVILRYEVYTGNKTEAHGGGGKRVREGELIVPAATTIEALKSLIITVSVIHISPGV